MSRTMPSMAKVIAKARQRVAGGGCRRLGSGSLGSDLTLLRQASVMRGAPVRAMQ